MRTLLLFLAGVLGFSQHHEVPIVNDHIVATSSVLISPVELRMVSKPEADLTTRRTSELKIINTVNKDKKVVSSASSAVTYAASASSVSNQQPSIGVSSKTQAEQEEEARRQVQLDNAAYVAKTAAAFKEGAEKNVIKAPVEATVIYKSSQCAAYIVFDTSKRYDVLIWNGGAIPREDDVLSGESFNLAGTHDYFDSYSRNITQAVLLAWGLSRTEAVEMYVSKCR